MGKTLGDITSELTARVLDPAKAEAETIVREARAKAEEIVCAAQSEAAKVREAAARDAEHTLRQLQVDMDTAARNFVLMVQEKLEAAIVEPTVEREVQAVLDDPAFLRKVIETVVVEFHKHFGREATLELLLPDGMKAGLEQWFIEKFRTRAVGPVTIQFTDKISFGFHLGASGTGSRFNFSAGLTEAFSAFCSPRFRRHFFASRES